MQSIGSQILAAAKERHPNCHHPRLIMTEADFAFLREKRHTGLYEKIMDHYSDHRDDCRAFADCGYLLCDGV